MAESDYGSINYSDHNIRFPKSTNTTFLGKIRSFSSLTILEWVFLVVCMLSLLSALGLTIYRIVTVDHTSFDYIFGIVLLANIVICMFYVVNGIFYERPYEIALLVIATVMLWLYLLLNYIISVKGNFKKSRLIVSSVLSPLIFVMGVIIANNYNKSKSLIFRTVGAEATMQEMCNTMFIFLGLLKADAQIYISLAILSYQYNLRALISVIVVFGFGFSFSGYLSVRYENKIASIIHGLLSLIVPAIAVFLIYKAAKELALLTDSKMETSLSIVLLVVAACCLIVRIACLCFGAKVYFNFGRGLKQKVYSDTTPQASSVNARQTEDA